MYRVLAGSFDVTLLGPSADDVIFSVTWSEGFLDEYVSFELPEVSDPLTEEEFDAIAEKPELEFDDALPGTLGTTEEVVTSEQPFITTESASQENYTASDLNNRFQKQLCMDWL